MKCLVFATVEHLNRPCPWSFDRWNNSSPLRFLAGRGRALVVPQIEEVHEVNEPKALKAVEAALDWSDLRIYDVNVPGLQHGVLLGTRRWPS
jgi:hypothetical protein